MAGCAVVAVASAALLYWHSIRRKPRARVCGRRSASPAYGVCSLSQQRARADVIGELGMMHDARRPLHTRVFHRAGLLGHMRIPIRGD